MTEQTENTSGHQGAGRTTAKDDPIDRLEIVFPDPVRLFKPRESSNLSDPNIIFVLDASCLLLPYSLTKESLASVDQVYRNLVAEGRLFVPARAAREFAANREEKLGQLLQHLNDCRSKVSISVPDVPILSSLKPFAAMQEAEVSFKSAKKQFSKAIEEMIAAISAWRGDDPISKIYSEVLSDKTVVDIPDAEPTALRKEWEQRLRLRRPPGYKDASKPDGGIGDFLIWKTILSLGQKFKRNIAFVTYDRKPDWMVRETYVRPELIDEFRGASDGCELRLCTLADVLGGMQAPQQVVNEVRITEESPRFVGDLTDVFVDPRNERRMIVVPMGAVSFDYSSNNGIIDIDHYDRRFTLRFSKHSDKAIYLYTGRTNLRRIARVKASAEPPDGLVSFEQFDSSSDVYPIFAGESFLAENTEGEIMAGRIDEIADDSRGSPADNVRFRFMTSRPKAEVWLPRPL
ncbi:PIN-like domain-containing protein [Phreatobacter sp. HK31-P]